MLICLLSKRSSYLLTALLVLVLASGCSLNQETNTPTPTVVFNPQPIGPTPTPVGISVPVCHLPACTNLNTVAGTRPFVDTWSNVHRFLTFDYNVHNPYEIAKKYDFIWYADPQNVAAYRAANPNIVLSYYMTMHRNDGEFINTDIGKQQGLAYWKALHPDWILYQCDRVTPAFENSDPNMPFILTNPAVLDWMVQNYVQPAVTYGYDAIAVDNVTTENGFKACGSYDKNGQWVQRYTGDNVDPQWENDVADWMTKMQDALHKQAKPMLLIANFSSTSPVPLNAPSSQRILAHIDGVLDESSFTHYGENNLSASQWLQMVQFVNTMQQQNKPFFETNEFKGAVAQSQPAEEWALASYLMCKQRLAMVYFAQIQRYGSDMEMPELDMQIGDPLDDMYFNQGAYWRDFSGGVSIVNPGTSPANITLKTSKSYVDTFGKAVSQTFTLNPHTGKVLLAKG